MSQDRSDELARRQEMALAMGGEDKLVRQAARGKLNARERLTALLDEDGFDEIGALAGSGQYFIFHILGKTANTPFISGIDAFLNVNLF